MRPYTVSARILIALFLAMIGILPAQAVGADAKTVPFVFTDIDGRSIRLADYRGQWVLVAFWAPWCPLCKLQNPALIEMDRRPDLSVIGIGLDYGDAAALRTSAESHNLNFPIVAGGKRRDPGSTHRQVGPVDFFPTSYLYDPAGEIAMYIPGQLRAAKVLAFMDNWRATPAGPAAAPVRVARTDKLAAFLKQRHGKPGTQAYTDWRRMADAVAGAAAPEMLARVNDFFNQRIRQSSDQRIWGRQDYWATLGELLGKGIGDSEDFVIAKYFTLLALDVPADRLRLVYVKAQGGNRNAADPVHMVLAYFNAPGQEPVLLDNRIGEILPASRRPDLRPVYSFNSEGAWGDEQEVIAVSGSRLPMWEDTLRRARNEGFE